MSKKFRALTGAKLGILISSTVVILLVAAVLVCAATYDKIFKNVYVLDTELSSLTQKEAEDLLFKQYYQIDPKATIKYKDASVELYFSEFGELDYATTAGEAFKIGRNMGVLSKAYAWCTPFERRNVEFTTYIKKENIINKIEELYKSDDHSYKDTTYKVEDEVLYITAGRSGDYSDTEEAISEIAEGMKKLQDVEVELKIKQGKRYEGVDVNKIYEEVCTEPKNAYYDEKSGKIVTHVVGYSFDIGEVKKLVENIAEDETVSVNLTVRLPEVTEAKLTGQMFSETLASYSTKYNPAEVDRTYNMYLASNKVNGTVIQPGGEFSYNRVVGERTVAAGYRNAKVFENGRVVDGLGGGICQVSSTIYNAALYANLEIVERKNHSFSVVYTPLGQDATVVMGAIDFRFKNNTNYPIKIVSSVNNGLCTVTILGTLDQPYKVEIVNTITSTKPFKTVYVQDDTLAFGEEKVVQTGQTGYNVSSVRNVYLNGELVKSEKISPSYYSARNKEIARNENAVDPNAPEETTDEKEEAVPVDTKTPTGTNTPETQKAPTGTKVPESPKAPEEPKTPEAPKAPETPKASEEPKAPETPKVPEEPKAPETPKVSEEPKAPEAPKAPEEPKAPEVPEETKQPETPADAQKTDDTVAVTDPVKEGQAAEEVVETPVETKDTTEATP